MTPRTVVAVVLASPYAFVAPASALLVTGVGRSPVTVGGWDVASLAGGGTLAAVGLLWLLGPVVPGRFRWGLLLAGVLCAATTLAIGGYLVVQMFERWLSIAGGPDLPVGLLFRAVIARHLAHALGALIPAAVAARRPGVVLGLGGLVGLAGLTQVHALSAFLQVAWGVPWIWDPVNTTVVAVIAAQVLAVSGALLGATAPTGLTTGGTDAPLRPPRTA